MALKRKTRLFYVASTFISFPAYFWARNATCKTPSPHKYVKYENEVFTLKTHQMFCVHITHEKFEIATISGHFEFVFEECSGREITHNSNAIFFRKLTFQNVLRHHAKPAFSNFFGVLCTGPMLVIGLRFYVSRTFFNASY